MPRRELSKSRKGMRLCVHCGAFLEGMHEARKYCSEVCKIAYRRPSLGNFPPPAFVGRYDLLPDHIRRNFTPGDPKDCWIYARRAKNGYAASTSVTMHKGAAYRLIYMLMVGPIPEGMEIDHTCDNGRAGCVNWHHLEAVTHQRNMTRPEHTQAGKHMRQTHCKHGHEFTPENTGTWVKGKRYCRQCMRDRQAKYRADGRAALYMERHRQKKREVA